MYYNCITLLLAHCKNTKISHLRYIKTNVYVMPLLLINLHFEQKSKYFGLDRYLLIKAER